MQIVIHKGTKEIGGTCIQLSTTNSTILLDLGMPLSKDSEFINYSEIKTDAVIISHPHQDHYGLINSIDSSIPVYIGEVGKHLINSGIRILWWKRAYKSPFSKFLISVEKSTPKLSVMS